MLRKDKTKKKKPQFHNSEEGRIKRRSKEQKIKYRHPQAWLEEEDLFEDRYTDSSTS